MGEVEVYSFEDSDGAESTFTTRSIEEAKAFARANSLKLIANTFEWSDSEVVEDNTQAEEDEE